MRDLIQKTCLFLFLAAVFAAKGSELGTLTGALAGTVLMWPFYKKYVPPLPKRRRVVVEVEAGAEPGSE
jgi:hypothetical protein